MCTVFIKYIQTKQQNIGLTWKTRNGVGYGGTTNV